MEVVYCPLCGKNLGQTSFATTRDSLIDGHLEIEHPDYCCCGELLEGHARCKLCNIYIGAGHLESLYQLREGYTLCDGCTAMYDRNPEQWLRYIQRKVNLTVFY